MVAQSCVSLLRDYFCVHPNYKIPFTRPTSPVSRRTLIPCGWAAELVRMSLTIPSVSFPVRWSFFITIETRSPGLMSLLLVPSMHYSPGVRNPSLIIHPASRRDEGTPGMFQSWAETIRYSRFTESSFLTCLYSI